MKLLSRTISFFLLTFAVLVRGQDFAIKLSLENAHVGELFFACQSGASAGYDRGKDIFCPPGGMGDVGLAWFAPPQADLPGLYKDVRDCTFPQEWKLEVQPPVRKKMSLHWEAELLPQKLHFQLIGNGLDLDMKKTSSLVISAKGVLLIKVSEDRPAATDEKN